MMYGIIINILIILILYFSSCTTRFTYEDAQKKGTPEAYYRFIVENPDLPETDLAKERIKDILFQTTLESKDILQIKRFISEFPDDPRSKKMESLLDEIRFNRAKDEKSINALKMYILQNPYGNYRKEAKTLIEEYEYEAVIRSTDIENLERYIREYPDSKHRSELQERLIELYYKKIESNDVKAAMDFLIKFPQNRFREEVLKIVLNEYNKISEFYCTPSLLYSDMLEDLRKEGVSQQLVDKFLKDRTVIEESLKKYQTELKNLSQGNIKNLTLNKGDITYLKDKKKVFSGYQRMMEYIRELNTKLNSDSVEQRIYALNRLRDYPFLPETLSRIFSLFFNSTIYERLLIVDLLKDSPNVEPDRVQIELYFFFKRNSQIYAVLKHFILSENPSFEELNRFYNEAFQNSRDDIVQQFLIISSAYQNGHNAFIKANINEHLKNLFSQISSTQAMCLTICPISVYYDLAGLNRILKEEIRISTNIFKEDSEIVKILIEKQKEIENRITSQKMPEIKTEPAVFIEKYDTTVLTKLKDSGILKLLYFLDPDKERRSEILRLLKEKSDPKL